MNGPATAATRTKSAAPATNQGQRRRRRRGGACWSPSGVAGGAALLFDPDKPDEIAGAMQRLLTDGAEADRLRAAGYERARQFTWDETARLTAESYERALSR